MFRFLTSCYGCVRLASLGWPRCVACFFSRTNVGNYRHTFVLKKKNATHRGRPREAKRTHPIKVKVQTSFHMQIVISKLNKESPCFSFKQISKAQFSPHALKTLSEAQMQTVSLNTRCGHALSPLTTPAWHQISQPLLRSLCSLWRQTPRLSISQQTKLEILASVTFMFGLKVRISFHKSFTFFYLCVYHGSNPTSV